MPANELPLGLKIIEGRLFMYRCPKCKLENYIMNVNLGICTWCGYNANHDYPPNKTNYDKENRKI